MLRCCFGVARDGASRLVYERRKKHQPKHGGGIYCSVILHSWQDSLSVFLSFPIHPGRVNFQRPNDKRNGKSGSVLSHLLQNPEMLAKNRCQSWKNLKSDILRSLRNLKKSEKKTIRVLGQFKLFKYFYRFSLSVFNELQRWFLMTYLFVEFLIVCIDVKVHAIRYYYGSRLSCLLPIVTYCINKNEFMRPALLDIAVVLFNRVITEFITWWQ